MTYTHGHPENVLRSYGRRTAENSAAYLLPHVQPGMDLLDVGCGPGSITIELASLVAPGRTVGIDSATAAIDAAKAAPGATAVDFRVADLMSGDLATGSFDVVHAHQVLQHVPDPVVALQQMARLCRPGGIIAARDADYAAMTWFPDSARLDEWQQLYRDVARANGGEPDAGRRLVDWAQRAGLTPQASASVWCYASDEERQWWGGLWAERVARPPFAERASELGLATQSDLDALADGWREWMAAPNGWFIVPHGEIVCRNER